MTNINNERAAFEAWAEREGFDWAASGGMWAFKAWQARALALAGKPVAWCHLNGDGQIAYFDGKPMVMPGPVGNECHPDPLYATHPGRRPAHAAHTARSFAEWSAAWINAHGYPPAAHEVYAALAGQAQTGGEPVPFADGENPCVLEWGAVSLPVGDPSRITEMKLCPTLWDAIAEGALCGFDWRVYPLALRPAA
jgi:hypothetical protein